MDFAFRFAAGAQRICSITIAAILAAEGARAAPSFANREAGLAVDMEPRPLQRSSGSLAGRSATAWRTVVTDASLPSGVRVHLRFKASAPEKITVVTHPLDARGVVIEQLAMQVDAQHDAEIWTDVIPGYGAAIDFTSDHALAESEAFILGYAVRIPTAAPKAIYGTNDLQPIGTVPAALKKLAPSIARLRTMLASGKEALCTAFVFRADLLMTNEHCIQSDQEARDTIADFGYESTSSDTRSIRVAKLERFNHDLDYAIVRLSSQPNAPALTMSGGQPADAVQLAVIGHPAGEPMQASLKDCSVRGVPISGVTSALTDFGHTCDTLGGSSGSPAIDLQTSGVVGLHHFGFDAAAGGIVNQAVLIDKILEDVRAKGPLNLLVPGAPRGEVPAFNHATEGRLERSVSAEESRPQNAAPAEAVGPRIEPEQFPDIIPLPGWYGARFVIQEENDAFAAENPSDNSYTQGLRISAKAADRIYVIKFGRGTTA